MASDLMQIEIIWKEIPTTCEPCVACKEPIYGKQYQMFTVIGGKESAMDTIVCGSCYTEIDKEN